MKILSNKKRAAAIGAVTASTVLVGGVAFAYWTSTGSGTGTAKTTAGVAAKLGFAQTTIADMYPGDTVQNFTVTVSNTDSAQKQYVTSLDAYITTDKTDCDGSNFLINGHSDGTQSTPTSLNWVAKELAPAATADSVNTIQFNNKVTNQDACKSAVVTLHYGAK